MRKTYELSHTFHIQSVKYHNHCAKSISKFLKIWAALCAEEKQQCAHNIIPPHHSFFVELVIVIHCIMNNQQHILMIMNLIIT